MKKENKFRLPTKMIVFFIIMILIYGMVAVQSYAYIPKSLFYERSANVKILMEKITQNVETGLTNRWNTLHALAYEIADTEFASRQEAQAFLAQKAEHRHEAIAALFFIDAKGSCYGTTDRVFQWPQMGMLTDAERQVYVSSDILPGEATEMFFITRLPMDVVVEEHTMTHLALACDMTFVDKFFDTSEFGEGSAAFIIQKDGTQEYRQESNMPLSQVQNVLAALYSADFQFDTSYDQLKSDIKNGVNTCVSLRYGQENYYLVCNTMSTNDWTAMLVIPEQSVGSASRVFLRSIILTIVAIALGGLTVLVVILISTNYSVTKQQEKVKQQLQRAVEAERNANTAKTKFLSSMSHDIRTPMNAIIGMTTLASSHLDDPVYIKSCLSKVTLASNHLLTLINDVLDISKVESGRMALNPIAFSLADTAQNIANIVRPQISAKKQQFEMRIHNVRHEHVFADEMRLNQIFINILSNAVKYTPEGGRITVDIKQEPVFGTVDQVRIVYVVEDNGIGMSKEFQKHMYTSFARAHGDQVNTIQGTGLGLAICKQMVDLMNGTIECESAEGHGTKFTVKLELPIAERLTDHLILPAMKVLLVDDDRVFLETAAVTLEELGLSPDCVGSGQEAVEQVIHHHEAGTDYPAVIIDWQMPGMDGEQTTRAIRAAVGEDVPIIIISAYERMDIEEAALAAGANGFIAKPFFKSTVYENMRQILGLGKDQPQEAKDDYQRGLSGMHILVAEDNDLNWEIANSLLDMYGISTIRAINGRECLDRLRQSGEGEFDLVLMDIQMPVMNGYEAARAIRQDSRRYVSSIPIIAMTADAFADDIQRCLAVGMNGHVAKPINIENLLVSLEKSAGSGLKREKS